jgi:signal transduction histidine kinase
LRQLLDDPDVTHVEIQAGKDTQWYEAHLSPLLHARGFRLGQLLLLHNVTEEKQAQAAQLERQRLLAAVEERHRVACELHDDLCQELAFINLQAQAVYEALAAGQAQQAGAYLSRLAEVAREAQADVRGLISGLMTTISPEQGFVETLRQTVEQFRQKYAIQAELRLVDEEHIPALEPVVEVQLLRIVQEALTNIRKHACARNVYVYLAATPTGVDVTVEDDGVGFNPSELAGTSGTYGLRIMSERVEELGGIFQVSSEPGCGTQVIVRIPVDSLVVGVSQ